MAIQEGVISEVLKETAALELALPLVDEHKGRGFVEKLELLPRIEPQRFKKLTRVPIRKPYRHKPTKINFNKFDNIGHFTKLDEEYAPSTTSKDLDNLFNKDSSYDTSYAELSTIEVTDSASGDFVSDYDESKAEFVWEDQTISSSDADSLDDDYTDDDDDDGDDDDDDDDDDDKEEEEEDLVDIVQVQWLFRPRKLDELYLEPGDMVYVYYKNEDGWYEGILGKERGLFPGCYTESIIESTERMFY